MGQELNMVSHQTQLSPCSCCGALKVGVIRNVWIEMISDAKKGPGNVLKPRFDVAVCPGCGLTQFFSRKDEEFLLDACNHEVVDVG
jgi:hypothetical protein